MLTQLNMPLKLFELTRIRQVQFYNQRNLPPKFTLNKDKKILLKCHKSYVQSGDHSPSNVQITCAIIVNFLKTIHIC